MQNIDPNIFRQMSRFRRLTPGRKSKYAENCQKCQILLNKQDSVISLY